jgi:regulator of protease activity HflC (stomatin/prohibitin superfamily)
MEELINKTSVGLMSVALLVLLAIIFLFMWGCPRYEVWQQGLKGQAELRRAEENRKITIEEALAKKEAAVSLAEAEVARARGVAESIKVVGDSLQDYEEYIQYLWVQGLHDGSSEVIYVPTESNLPILEAVRLKE